jgi:NitT/TauT family transport system substrate-binding protein
MTTLSRRSVLAGAAATLAAPAPAIAQALPEIRSLRSTAKSWLWLAEDYALANGLFQRAGVKVESTASNRGVNVDSLLSNATDIVIGAPTQTMRVQVQGRPLKMIAGMVNKYASHIVIKKAVLDRLGVDETSPEDRKIAALRGLKLGTTGPGGAPDSLFRWLLARGRMNPDSDVQLVAVQGAGPALLAALERGAIDGFCLSSPTSDAAVARFGAAYLFNMSRNPPAELADYLYIAVSVNQRTFDEKGPGLTGYCKGIALALRGMRADPDGLRTWARGFFGDMEPDLFERSFASDSRIYLAEPRVTEAHFRLNLVFLEHELRAVGQSVPSSFGYAQAYDMRYVDEALRGL